MPLFTNSLICQPPRPRPASSRWLATSSDTPNALQKAVRAHHTFTKLTIGRRARQRRPPLHGRCRSRLPSRRLRRATHPRGNHLRGRCNTRNSVDDHRGNVDGAGADRRDDGRAPGDRRGGSDADRRPHAGHDRRQAHDRRDGGGDRDGYRADVATVVDGFCDGGRGRGARLGDGGCLCLCLCDGRRGAGPGDGGCGYLRDKGGLDDRGDAGDRDGY